MLRWSGYIGKEYLGDVLRYPIAPLSEKYFVFISSSFREKSGTGFKSLNFYDSGCVSVIKELANMCSIACFCFQVTENYDVSNLKLSLFGSIFSNCWVVLEKFNVLPLEIIKTVCKEILILQQKYILAEINDDREINRKIQIKSNEDKGKKKETKILQQEELNFTKGFEIIPNHSIYFEGTVGEDFFTTNDDYLNGKDLSQDPVFNLESHLSYDLIKNLVISFDYYGHWGGSSKLVGREVDNSAVDSQTIGGTLAYNLTPSWQVLLQYKEDVQNTNGINAQTIQARLFYATDFGKIFH